MLFAASSFRAMDTLEVGMKLHAQSAADGVFYPAEVMAISESKKRTQAPVRVKFAGYEEEEWKSLAELKSKWLTQAAVVAPVAKTAVPAGNSAQDSKKSIDLKVLEKGSKLQAQAEDGKWYKAEVLVISKGKVKVNYQGYTKDSDEWVTADRLRSKLLGKTKPVDINPKSRDPDGLLEYSVVYTDRAINHMSKSFQATFKDLSALLCRAYKAERAILMPGSGTTGMEAVARQFANGKSVLVVRNGFFSFRWSQIFDMGKIPSKTTVMNARPSEEGPNPSYSPCPVDEVVAAIKAEKPAVVFAPRVETSAGMMLPNDYIKQVGAAAKEIGALFVLDCVACGCLWVNMPELNVDVLCTAPQKGWSAPSGVGVVMVGPRALETIASTTSSSFALDLKKWLAISDAYYKPPPGHAYHATFPTDVITDFLAAAQQVEKIGFDKIDDKTNQLGQKVRAMLATKNIKSVASAGFQAPTVVVSYTSDAAMKSGAKFGAEGMQIAAGVPLMCDEFTSGADFVTWRIGLFGLDKLGHIPRTVAILEQTLSKVLQA